MQERRRQGQRGDLEFGAGGGAKLEQPASEGASGAVGGGDGDSEEARAEAPVGAAEMEEAARPARLHAAQPRALCPRPPPPCLIGPLEGAGGGGGENGKAAAAARTAKIIL